MPVSQYCCEFSRRGPSARCRQADPERHTIMLPRGSCPTFDTAPLPPNTSAKDPRRLQDPRCDFENVIVASSEETPPGPAFSAVSANLYLWRRCGSPNYFKLADPREFGAGPRIISSSGFPSTI